jgi:CRISPR-associated protein Csx1
MLVVHVLVAVMGMPWRRYVERFRSLSLVDRVLSDYFYWSSVSYAVDGYVQRTISPVPVLYSYIASKDGAPLKTIVIVQETAVAKLPTIGADYSSILSAVKDMYKEFLEWQGVGEGLEIVVAPGVGRFKNVAVREGIDANVFVDVCGAASDFQYVASMRLAKSLLGIVKGLDSDEDLVVHLDTTHGLNYTPTLTRAVLLELLTIVASYAGVRNVVLRVYNSESVVKEALKDVYNIHLVEEVRIKSENRFSTKPSIEGVEKEPRVLVLNKVCVQQGVEKIGREVSKASSEVVEFLELNDADRVNAFAGSLINGLPLLALETMPRASLSQFVNKVLNTYTRFVAIDVCDRWHEVTVNVVKQGKLHPHVKVLTKLLLAKELISMRISKGYDYDEGVELSALARYVEDVLYSWSNRLRITINFDYISIVRILEEKNPISRWTLLASLTKPDPSSECSEELKEVDRFERNFIQHSGLHSCITEVGSELREGATVYRVRYSKRVFEDLNLRKVVYGATSEGVIRI